jgi:imidazole glycerol phosphate synthase subunit HisF
MRVLPKTIWKCTNERSEDFGKLCVVKSVDNNPDYNGDGDVEVMYSDGTELHTKVRRFMLNHEYIGQSTL